jgi:hypothetical protein
VPLGLGHEIPVSDLVGDVGQRARELLREIARSNEMTIYAGAINRDHVHMLISSAVCGEGGSVLEGEEFAQAPFGISSASETLLGSTSMGARLLGGIERQRHR